MKKNEIIIERKLKFFFFIQELRFIEFKCEKNYVYNINIQYVQ